ncbi:MAG: hypothetical protein ACOC1K_02305 [Nanoarchaeota archaeon]
MSDFEKSKFRFSETFNNRDGKTSGSGFVGVIMGLIASLGFVGGLVGFFFGLDGMISVLEMSIQLGFLSSILMGVRKVSGVFGNNKLEAGTKE